MAANKKRLDPIFYPWVTWHDAFIPRELVANEEDYTRLQGLHWPRYRLEVGCEDGATDSPLDRLQSGEGGVRIELKTLKQAHEAPPTPPDLSLEHLLGYDELLAAGRRGEAVYPEIVPRLDSQVALMILQALRLAGIARRDSDPVLRQEARERLRQASRALGISWPGTISESETPKSVFVAELRELLVLARRTVTESGLTADILENAL